MSAQEEFDRRYISSIEICGILGITRSCLTLAKSRGTLPKPIDIKGGSAHIWERQAVEPILVQWKAKLDARRGVVNA